MNLKLNVDGEFSLSVSGTADFILTGRAQSSTYDLSGAGSLDAMQFQVSGNINACSSGAGNLRFQAMGQLSAVSSGVGNIAYTGNPTIIRSCSSEMGSITHIK